jgi:DNA-binding MarR family transcriptional regulator
METTGGPRWLDEDEHAAWRLLAGMLRRLPAALDSQLLQDAGLNHFEYEVMAGLSMSPRRTQRMSALAAFAQGSLPRLSRVINRMESRGWAHRSADPTDGRATLVSLTDAGWDKVVDAAPGHVEAVRSYVFDPLTKAQVRQLGTLCARIVNAIESRQEPPP